MKERPILYSTPMIQAKLAGRKTKTRRIMKVQPDNDCYFEMKIVKKVSGGLACMIDYNQGDNNTFVQCPYGKVGDILWARETFGKGYNSNLDSNIGKEEKDWTLRYWIFKDGSQIYSDGSYYPDYKTGEEESFHSVKWKPSIHMPKAAARIWERITDIRVERLQDISEEDAIAEGIEKFPEGYIFNNYLEDSVCHSAVESYRTLWESINGPGSWELSPWVWVITTEVLSTTGRPKDL